MSRVLNDVLASALCALAFYYSMALAVRIFSVPPEYDRYIFVALVALAMFASIQVSRVMK